LVSKQSVETRSASCGSRGRSRASGKSLELLQAGPRPEEVRATRARLAVVRGPDGRRSRTNAGRTRIQAPIAGQVLTPYAEHLVGRYVERGDSLLVLADLQTVMLEIPVPEKEVADVTYGHRCSSRPRSLAGRTFEGRVVGIAPAAESGPRQRTVLVRSEIDNADGMLRAGTTGYAKILCGERRLGDLALRRGVRMLRTEFWALW
jgi:multidrug resistance efflux pump